MTRERAPVALTAESDVRGRVEASRRFVQQAVASGRSIYGVTSGFGGMAHLAIPPEQAEALQNNLPWFLKTGCGERLVAADVRAGMLLRANALMRGASGIRLCLIERLVLFLNAGVIPHVFALGSIGASGDLVPLANITGALIGLSDDFLVDHDGETLPAPQVLRRLELEPLPLAAKEGLALMNGTSVLTGIAAGCVVDARAGLALALAIHALVLQGMAACTQPFAPFLQQVKPHPGQAFVAGAMRRLLHGSGLTYSDPGAPGRPRDGGLLQDRYSVRCLPQFLGPIVDGLAVVASQVEVEMNAATDNPLFDPEAGIAYHGGNFLGQYVAMGMDQIRHYLGLLAKHLDSQLSLLVEPAFSGGLPESLVGNSSRMVNMGLKGLQITGNSIMPMITHLGVPLVDRFPTHAEQFNQNINCLGLGAATLTRRSLDLFQHYLAVAMIFAVQSVDLRTRLNAGHADGRSLLSPATLPLYEAILSITGRQPSRQEAFIHNDDDRPLDRYLAALSADVRHGRELVGAVAPLIEVIAEHHPLARDLRPDPSRPL